MTSIIRFLPILAASIFIAPSLAAPIVFSGADANVGPGDPSPNAAAAAASFGAAAGAATLLTLETASGTTSPVALGNGVIVSSTSTVGIANSGDPYFGFNTTPGGANFLYLTYHATGTYTFTFPNEITAFAVNTTGLFSDVSASFSFFDGAAQSVAIPGLPASSLPSANVFFGFINAAGFSSLTLNMVGGVNYRLGFDDIQFVSSASTVPEPASGLLAVVALAAFGAYRRAGAKIVT